MKLPELKIGDMIARIPIIQGGMGVGISLSGLASAVANEGGIGVISTVGICFKQADAFSNFVESNNRALREEIRKAKAMTKGLLGVNILGAMTNYDEIVKTSIEEGIDVIISGAGLPLNLPKFKIEMKSNVKLAPIASSGRSAAIICKSWDTKYNCAPDIVIVEGPKAGGHLGFSYKELQVMEEHNLEKLIVDVIEAVKPYEEKYGRKIPVIAAGGIYTGTDIARIMELGAAGVQMGTRFVATEECDASPIFKEALLNCKEEDIVIINSPVGLPGRAVNNKFLELVAQGHKVPIKCPYHCLKTCKVEDSPYCIAAALVAAAKGIMNNGFAFCGANAWRVNKIVSVKELMQELVTEAELTFKGVTLSPAV